jgi:hypothetical protein
MTFAQSRENVLKNSVFLGIDTQKYWGFSVVVGERPENMYLPVSPSPMVVVYSFGTGMSRG